MLTSQTNVEVRTETDLTTGRKAYVASFSPVPVITPIGPAPGELRVVAEPSGRVTALEATLRPSADAVAQMAEVLARVADFELPAAELRGLPPGSRPTLVFAARPEALAGLGVLVIGPQDLGKVLDAPMLADVRSLALVDLLVES